MDPKDNHPTIYVELLNEGTPCVRPTQGVPLGNGNYLLLPTANYDPDVECWQFPPGCVVRCRVEVWSDKDLLVAREQVEPN